MVKQVYFASAARTPWGVFKALYLLECPRARRSFNTSFHRPCFSLDSQIDEVIMGNVVSAGLKQAPARKL
ncbi:MAG: hypothetical protein Ct9H90mP27_3000 [Gammaproteobacteria bacterium]|nr:MAG: hypothetical protein Ct9H90mP27_3000 [Gammaproteobacteria bacterium]